MTTRRTSSSRFNPLLQPHVEKVKVTTRPERIVDFMESYRPDVILLDMNFHHDASSGQEGFHWLQQIHSIDPNMVVIFITAYGDTEKAVRAIKGGGHRSSSCRGRARSRASPSHQPCSEQE